MKRYSKLVGSVVGAAAGVAIAFGVLPEQFATAEYQSAIVLILSGLLTYFAPAND